MSPVKTLSKTEGKIMNGESKGTSKTLSKLDKAITDYTSPSPEEEHALGLRMNELLDLYPEMDRRMNALKDELNEEFQSKQATSHTLKAEIIRIGKAKQNNLYDINDKDILPQNTELYDVYALVVNFIEPRTQQKSEVFHKRYIGNHLETLTGDKPKDETIKHTIQNFGAPKPPIFKKTTYEDFQGHRSHFDLGRLLPDERLTAEVILKEVTERVTSILDQKRYEATLTSAQP